jgi:succinoglycan biosynthesis protein ExoM
MRIDLLICTYRRTSIADTLRSIAMAEIPDPVSLRIVVVDNDDTPSAHDLVTQTAEELGLKLDYVHAPGANISIARNAALEAACAPWIAFLDDDEEVTSGWLPALMARQKESGADGVFGPSHAIYPDHAPDWMVQGDFHSQAVVKRGGVVQTGHTCNALLRWGDAPWSSERFDLKRGKSGGEDTEFFFRLHRMGAKFAIAEQAIVTEPVPQNRLSLDWLLKRRYRIGQSYAASANSLSSRARLFVMAGIKTTYCHLRALQKRGDAGARAYWLMRGRMHLGVCAGCLNARQADLYGG